MVLGRDLTVVARARPGAGRGLKGFLLASVAAALVINCGTGSAFAAPVSPVTPYSGGGGAGGSAAEAGATGGGASHVILGEDGDAGATPDAGGGGGGANRRNGGEGGNGALGGAGGSVDGAAGSDGEPGSTNIFGGGGGGGGAGVYGYSGALTDLSTSYTGGAGGAGGSAAGGSQAPAGAGGGGGGGGGAGAVLTSTSYSGRVTISADQTGGIGGAGGAGAGEGYGGNGATGGAGIVLYSTVKTPLAAYVTISSTTTITGGAGGAGGTAGLSAPANVGIAGNGGAGIEVAEGTGKYAITVSGTVTGGAAGGDTASGGPGIVGANLSVFIMDGGTVSGGAGATPGAAILFTGGSNVVDLSTGGTLVGNVLGAGAGDIIELIGEGQATLNMSQVAGFGSYNMASTGTWTLNGPTSGATQWYFQAGTLAISDFASLGSEASLLTFYGGTLAVTASSSTAMTVSLTTYGGGGTIQVANAATATMSGVISGEGALTKTGAGTLILLADNTYTGGTTISEGTLQLGNGGTTGSVLGTIVNNAALIINRSGTYDFPNTITGSGSVEILGGTVNFTGAGGYNGTISVVDSSFVLSQGSTSASTFTIGSDATISGTGTIGGLTVLNGGTAAPGYSPGTLTVNGNVVFASGSVYRVDITPEGATDLITATGTATISGGTVQVVASEGTYAPGTTYTILTAQGGVTGQFSGLTVNYAYLDPSLTYDANNVYLLFARNATAFPDSAYTPNQKAAARSVESLGAGSSVYDAVLQLSTSAAPAAFDALSGEVYASASSVMQQQSIYLREAVGSRVRQGLAGEKAPGQATAQLAPGYDATVWAYGYGGWGQFSGDGNAASVDSSIGGFLMGVDAAVTPSTRVGLVGGYSRSTLTVDARSSSGDIDNYDVGVYGGAEFGALSLFGAVSYTWHDLSVDRTVAFAGFSGLNSANYDAGTAQVFGEAAWRIGLDTMLDPKTFGTASVTPFVNLAYVNLSSDAFTETGSASALTGSADTENTFYSTLGVRAATRIEMANGAALTPHLSLGWQHAFGDVNANANLAFVAGGSAFTVSGVPIGRDSALVGAGVEYAFSKTVAASLAYSGQFASGIESNAFKGAMSIKF